MAKIGDGRPAAIRERFATQRAQTRERDKALKEYQNLTPGEQYLADLNNGIAESKRHEQSQFIWPGEIRPGEVAESYADRVRAGLTWAKILRIKPANIRKHATTLRKLEEIIFKEWCKQHGPGWDYTLGELYDFGHKAELNITDELPKWYVPLEDENKPLEESALPYPYGTSYKAIVELPKAKEEAIEQIGTELESLFGAEQDTSH